MRRKPVIVLAIVGLIFVPVYLAPIIASASNAKPLYGYFDIGSVCMGGHETFLILEEDLVFTYCPGHRDKNQIGRIARHESQVTIYPLEGDEPVFRIHYDGSNHHVESLKASSW